MTANLPNVSFRLGENDVLFGAEGAPGVPYLDHTHYIAVGRRLQARAVKAAAAGLFRRAIDGIGTRRD